MTVEKIIVQWSISRCICCVRTGSIPFHVRNNQWRVERLLSCSKSGQNESSRTFRAYAQLVEYLRPGTAISESVGTDPFLDMIAMLRRYWYAAGSLKLENIPSVTSMQSCSYALHRITVAKCICCMRRVRLPSINTLWIVNGGQKDYHTAAKTKQL